MERSKSEETRCWSSWVNKRKGKKESRSEQGFKNVEEKPQSQEEE